MESETLYIISQKFIIIMVSCEEYIKTQVNQRECIVTNKDKGGTACVTGPSSTQNNWACAMAHYDIHMVRLRTVS